MSKGESNLISKIDYEALYRAVKVSPYTSGQLAELVGVTWVTFSRWMNGRTKIPADAYMAICDRIMHDPFDFYKEN